MRVRKHMHVDVAVGLRQSHLRAWASRGPQEGWLLVVR